MPTIVAHFSPSFVPLNMVHFVRIILSSLSFGKGLGPPHQVICWRLCPCLIVFYSVGTQLQQFDIALVQHGCQDGQGWWCILCQLQLLLYAALAALATSNLAVIMVGLGALVIVSAAMVGGGDMSLASVGGFFGDNPTAGVANTSAPMESLCGEVSPWPVSPVMLPLHKVSFAEVLLWLLQLTSSHQLYPPALGQPPI